MVPVELTNYSKLAAYVDVGEFPDPNIVLSTSINRPSNSGGPDAADVYRS